VPLFVAGDVLTGSSASSLILTPDEARPRAVDGPLHDVLADLDAQFVVEWQVVDSWQPRDVGSQVRAH
jgi:hypothetical protein